MFGFDAISDAPLGTLAAELTAETPGVELPVVELVLSAGVVTATATVVVCLPVVTLQLLTPIATTMRDVVVPAQRIYRAYLDDIELPISSTQMRLRAATNSYLSVVVPNGPKYADIIAEHASGELRVMQGWRFVDGSEQLELLAAGTVKLAPYDRGAKSRTVTLSAYGANVTPSSRRRELQGVSYVRTSGGDTTVRARPDAQLKPGDTAVYDAGEFVVDLITVNIGVSANGKPTETMEVTA